MEGLEVSTLDYMKDFVGQKVAVLCNRYQYRGVLSAVVEGKNDFLVIANATAVEISGPSNSDTPSTEDPIGGSIAVNVSMIELVYQPKWCMANLPGE